jgi:UDP-N-acetylglucosamine transferase subunit ALG13
LIFVTVGTQLPFDRLVGKIDSWCASQPDREVIAQVGPSEREFRSMTVERFVTPERFEALFSAADLVVAHAGMGTILSAMEAGKPLLVMPRRAALGEHRNDHQMATAMRLEDRLGLAVAWDEEELPLKLDTMLERGASAPRISPYADARLIGFVRSFISG